MARKPNPHFDDAFLDDIEQKLQEEKTKVEDELNRLTQVVEYGTEEDDEVHEDEESTVNRTIVITLQKKLRDIEAALKRLEDGTYGICKYTNEPIEQARLIARPTSTSSVAAKKLLTEEA